MPRSALPVRITRPTISLSRLIGTYRPPVADFRLRFLPKVDWRFTLIPPTGALASLAVCLQSVVSLRRERSWLAMTGLPLLMTSAALTGVWWTWVPLILMAWWWSPPAWPWAWVLAGEMAVLSSVWAYVGIDALANFPRHRDLVAVVWIGSPLSLAYTGFVARHRYAVQDALMGGSSVSP